MRCASSCWSKVISSEGCDEPGRHVVWKLLLGVVDADAERYIALVERGAFRSDAGFRSRVSDAAIARVLNALCHHIDGGQHHIDGGQACAEELRDAASTFGANRCVLGATLLYAMPSELEAFWSLEAVVCRHCPQYFTPDLHGARLGAALAERCLGIVDAQLHRRIAEASDAARAGADQSRGRKASAFSEFCAFPLLASFFACAPPLAEVVRIWDALFAGGAHLNVLICVAVAVSLRDELLAATSSELLLGLQPRRLPKLDARKLISIALELAPVIPAPLYDLIVAHPFRRIETAQVDAIQIR
ncbi:hypothetical protein M885DRAFT_557672 [Pelagophyceae sp. CCMP2097]|nr:hypothetical protein M885DRAFT_557672 [Pelagophyceae sp. CCMP2097]